MDTFNIKSVPAASVWVKVPRSVWLIMRPSLDRQDGVSLGGFKMPRSRSGEKSDDFDVLEYAEMHFFDGCSKLRILASRIGPLRHHPRG